MKDNATSSSLPHVANALYDFPNMICPRFYSTFFLFSIIPVLGFSFPIHTQNERSFPLSQLVIPTESSRRYATPAGGDDDNDITPYKDRSLAWTKRYRKLIPYEAARLTAMRLGLCSEEEWEDIRQFGKAFHGAHLVSRPDLMYQKEWIIWEEFLGAMRPYDEAKELVHSLNIQNMDDYVEFVKANTKRAESLRIPAKPEIVYRNKGWEGPDAFFGNNNNES